MPKKTAKRRKGRIRKRLPISRARLRQLAFDSEDIVHADAAIDLKMSLVKIFRLHPQLRAEWKRGRFLRDVKMIASKSDSVSQAAVTLGLPGEQAFRDMLAADVELADIWKEGQLELYLATKARIFALADDGTSWAVRIVDNFLRSRDDRQLQSGDLTRVTSKQLADLTGKTVQTIYDWRTKHGLTRNNDRTFDLHIFISWFEEFILGKMAHSKDPGGALDRLKVVKAEKLEMELAAHRGRLLDQAEVEMGQIAWFQNALTFCSRRTEELARLCYGQPREKIMEVLRRFFFELKTEMVKVPEELRLPASIEKELARILMQLKSNENNTS